MKKITIIFVLLLSCYSYAQRKPKIKGSRNVTEVKQELSPYSSIELLDDMEIILQKGTSESYTIEADDNLMDVLKFKVEDAVLKISSFYRITSKKKLKITVHYVDLDKIVLQKGKIVMEDVISTNELEVYTYGSSKLQLKVNAEVVSVSMEGNSSGDFNIDTDSLHILLKDKVQLDLYTVTEKASIQMEQNASTIIAGTVGGLEVNLEGKANLKGAQFEAVTAKVTLQESTSAKIQVMNAITLIAKGNSKTYLYGSPKITITEFMDTSQLFKKQE